MKILINLLVLGFIILFIFKGIKIKKNNSAITGSKLETIVTKRKINSISELATASQLINIRTDTVYTSVESTGIYIRWIDVTIWSFGDENVTNQLIYVQKFEAKSGFKDVEVWRNDSVIEIIYSGPEILSFELKKDSVILENGTWTKTGTSAIEEMNRERAKNRINHDSLFAATQRNFNKLMQVRINELAPGLILTFKRR